MRPIHFARELNTHIYVFVLVESVTSRKCLRFAQILHDIKKRQKNVQTKYHVFFKSFVKFIYTIIFNPPFSVIRQSSELCKRNSFVFKV